MQPDDLMALAKKEATSMAGIDMKKPLMASLAALTTGSAHADDCSVLPTSDAWDCYRAELAELEERLKSQLHSVPAAVSANPSEF